MPLPGRELRELDDGLLLYDPRDGDPFWNRFEAVRWPSEPAAFDRRLDELMVQFASFGRRPHVWASPGHDSPADLVGRFLAAGFEDVGAGMMMLLVDAALTESVILDAARRQAGDVEVERWTTLPEQDAEWVAAEIVAVLLDAFGVDDVAQWPHPDRDRGLAEPSVVHPLRRPLARDARRRRPPRDVRRADLSLVGRNRARGAWAGLRGPRVRGRRPGRGPGGEPLA